MKKASSFFLKIRKNFCSSYKLLNSYKCDYGQGGTLQLKLENRLYDLKLETIWEDFTEVETWKKPEQQELHFLTKNEGPKLDIFQISDGNYKSKSEDLAESNKYEVNVKLPEYYSYKIKVNGSVQHKRGAVDPKTYGNVEITTILDKGDILLSKVKSELCNLQSTNGKIHVSSALEAQKANISTDSGDIFIKKMGLTGKGHIFSQSGNITISSLYGAPQNEPITEQMEINEIPTEIHKSNFLSINSMSSNVSIGNVHGNLIVNCIEGNIEIKRCDANQLLLENEKGGIHINIINLKQNSLIKVGNNGDLRVSLSPTFEGNVFLIDTNCFWGEENQKQGVPTLYIKGKISEKAINLKAKNDIYNFLKN